MSLRNGDAAEGLQRGEAGLQRPAQKPPTEQMTFHRLPTLHLRGNSARRRLALSLGHVLCEVEGNQGIDHAVLRLHFPNVRLAVPESEHYCLNSYSPESVRISLEPFCDNLGMICIRNGPTQSRDEVTVRRTAASCEVTGGPNGLGIEWRPQWEYETTLPRQEVFASSCRGSLDTIAEWTFQCRLPPQEEPIQEGVILCPENMWSEWLVPLGNRSSRRIGFKVAVHARLRCSWFKHFPFKTYHLTPESRLFFVDI